MNGIIQLSESELKKQPDGSVETEEIIPEPLTLGDKIKIELAEWGRLLVVFIPAVFFFSFLLFEQRVIPSESMVPNLQVGDRVLVNKFAYGYSRFSIPWGVQKILPLGNGRIFARQPKRGDVVVFMHPHFDRVMIKRLIGLPGDRVEMRDEALYLNGEPVPTDFVRQLAYVPDNSNRAVQTREYRETLGDREVLIHQWGQNSKHDTTGAYIVPEGHFFFMGDNRDNSTDARDPSGHCRPVRGVVDRAGCTPRVSLERASVGFVPFDHIIGKGQTVAWTTKRCRQEAGLACPPKRVWKPL